MRFTPVALGGPMIVDVEAHEDARGGFARVFCAEAFARAGLPAQFVQCNLSSNHRRGTLRGLHYQREPNPEGKLVRCTRGAVYDVAVDLRANSATRGRWVAVELAAGNQRALWIPPGFAHGFLTLCDETDVFYQMTAAYQPAYSAGLRWDDPTLAIPWPVADPIVSPRDRALPGLHEPPVVTPAVNRARLAARSPAPAPAVSPVTA